MLKFQNVETGVLCIPEFYYEGTVYSKNKLHLLKNQAIIRIISWNQSNFQVLAHKLFPPSDVPLSVFSPDGASGGVFP